MQEPEAKDLIEKTATGLDQNVAAALAYVLGWISGIAFLLVEPSNTFVRFHAWQSIIVFGALSIAWFVSLALGLIFWFFAFVVIPPLSAILWLLLMFKAYRGERYKLPFAGDMASHREL
ncbi:MAG: hypothetical protein ABIP65_04140 [Vicinamibacterales bacterium]